MVLDHHARRERSIGHCSWASPLYFWRWQIRLDVTFRWTCGIPIYANRERNPVPGVDKGSQKETPNTDRGTFVPTLLHVKEGVDGPVVVECRPRLNHGHDFILFHFFITHFLQSRNSFTHQKVLNRFGQVKGDEGTGWRCNDKEHESYNQMMNDRGGGKSRNTKI